MHIVIGQILIFLTGYRFLFYTIDIPKQVHKYIIQCIVGSHILYKDSKKAPEAARVMKVTAADLKELGLIERIIPEEEPANTDTLYRIAGYMDRSIIGFFEKYLKLSGEELAEHRYERFRRM